MSLGRERPRRSVIAGLFTLLVCAVVGVWLVGETLAGAAACAEGAAPADSTPTRARAAARDAEPFAAQGPPLEREVWRPPDAAPEASFEAVIAQLCELSGATADLAQQDEHEAAKALDEQARSLLGSALQRFGDAGERALAMVVELPAVEPGAPRPKGQNIRLGVLQVVLAAELARRHEIAARLGERGPRDDLVAAALAAMPIGANTAEMGDRILHQRPYLGLCHEPQVLELVEQAGAGSLARPIATRMLLTLWENLRESGQRTSEELSRLALLLLDDAEPSQVVVACRHLLADDRYRAIALAWLRERGDQALAGEVAQLAGRELPPQQALAVLRALGSVLKHTRGALLAVGVRAPELLADAYREQLAAGTQPALRREMVMGVGMLPDASGLEIARLALDHDPAVEVRLQAMFVFTVHGAGAGAEGAIHQILDDPRVAADPDHLGAVVIALQNLEDDDPNVIARLGARLQVMPLRPRSRELLDELLARSLPRPGG